MALLAVLLAQTLDPVRVVVLAVIFWVSRVAAGHAIVRWFCTLFGGAVVAGFFPYLLGRTGDDYNRSALVGFLSSAVLIVVFMLVAKLWKGRV